MSTTEVSRELGPTPEPPPARHVLPPMTGAARGALLAVGVLLVLSSARAISDADDLTSQGTTGAALRVTAPILLAALGGLYAERCGVVNIGLEGMMILGTWGGAWGGYVYGPWWGVVIGIVAGMLGGLVHAVATVTFGVDHIISGVAINIAAPAVARYLAIEVFEPAGGGATQSPRVDGSTGRLDVPFLAGGDVFGWKSPDILRWFDDKDVFFVSDVAGMARGVVAGVSWFTIIVILLVPFSAILLWRTPFGLRLRSVGENPAAAESLGVPVSTMRYVGVLISGGLAGMAGAFLVIEQAGIYREGQTGGRGFIGLGAMIFGNWFPGGAATGSGVFGFTYALELRDASAVHALLLGAAIASALGVLYALWRQRFVLAAILTVVCAATGVWYGVTDTLPLELTKSAPYLITLVVLIASARRIRPPAAEGIPYRRGGAR
jgi:general nucleoside transport system permease protein